MDSRNVLNLKRLLSVFVIASFCLKFFNTAIAEYEVLTKEPEKERFVNPFPRDKFVFMEISESYYGDIYSGMLLRPLAAFRFDQKDKTVRINDPSKRSDNNTLIIIGHMVGFGAEDNSGGSILDVFKINSLPYKVDISTTASQFREGNLVEDLTLLNISDRGIVKLKYGKAKIILNPGRFWSTSRERIVKSERLKHTLRIINYGLLDKEKTKERNLQWDQKQQKKGY